ncbi:MAG TPA: GNAT family N-acetyltransferase [Puia sp.]|jgi:putative acetyltransferase|nr:GNAT family N-acetyltransferase [Puia sp.]
MKNIHIRPIRPEDNIAIASVIRQVLAEFKANKPGTVFYDPTTDNLFQLFSERNAVYFIAVADGEVVGGSGVFPTTGLPDGYCELVKLYLLPEMRGRGLGLKLMEKCFQKSIELGFSHIYLETMPELRSAIGLYEKAGFSYLPGPLGQSGHFGCDLWMTKNLH